MIRSVISRTSPAFFSIPLMLITDITAKAAQPYRHRIRRIRERFFRSRKNTAAAAASTQPVLISVFSSRLVMAVSYCRAEEINP